MAPMSSLLDRAQAALAPTYRVEASLGVGGMGEVFRAADTALDRFVAIKVLRPEVATQVAVERFLREGRLLARLTHPSIVQVHHAGVADGLYYLVMELQGGETLGVRLERGVLPLAEAAAVTRDVLAALAHAHAADVIHRDVKPSNIFLTRGGARLGDFGIAHDESDSGLTRTGAAMGTVAYMAPEQRAGLPSTSRTDLHAAGAVLYECLTGRRWVETQGDWSRVPPALAAVLRRALEHDPARRWPDAQSFTAAVDAALVAPVSRRAWLTAGSIALIPLAAIGLTLLLRDGTAAPPRQSPRPAPAEPSQLVISLAPFAADASDPAAAVERGLRRRLGEAGVRLAGEPGVGPAGLVLTPAIVREGEVLVVSLAARGGRGEVRALHVERRGLASAPAALADSLAADAVLELWREENTDSLPREALPHRLGALVAWAAGERHFARAEWSDAQQAYSKARREDAGCLMCEWRLQLIARWYQASVDPGAPQRLAAQAARFPEPFRSLIRAAAQPFPSRIDSLRAVRDRHSGDHLAHFLYGDELMHRGPLAGTPRGAAAEAFAASAALRPGFLPAVEHTAWLAITEGDAPTAARALARYAPAPDGDPYARSIAALLQIALTWRFDGPAAGSALLDNLLAQPDLAQSRMAGTAPRFLVSFGAPDGALALAGRFLGDPAFAAHRSAAAYARAFAFAAMGQPDSAVAAFGRLADPGEAARWRALLASALAAADPGDPDLARLAAEQRPFLATLAADRRAPPGLAAEAALVATLLGATPAAPPAGPARVLADAERMARRGEVARALARTEPLEALDPVSGPFFRALLHLRRGDWRAALGDAEGARREWTWHENQDVEGSLLEGPVSAEFDWALGTLGRWRRARAESSAAACADYGEVARLWAAGNALARARADSALAARRALACGGP